MTVDIAAGDGKRLTSLDCGYFGPCSEGGGFGGGSGISTFGFGGNSMNNNSSRSDGNSMNHNSSRGGFGSTRNTRSSRNSFGRQPRFLSPIGI